MNKPKISNGREDMPEEVQNFIETNLNSKIYTIKQTVHGNTLADKWVVGLKNGNRCFIKTASDDQCIKELLAEQKIINNLPDGIAPKIILSSEKPPVSVMEDLSDAQWRPSFSDKGKALQVLLHRLKEINPPQWLRKLPQKFSPIPNWQRVKDNPQPFLELGLCSKEWLDQSISALIKEESKVDISGNSLVHGDTTDSNMCYTENGAVLADWGWACIGNHGINVLCAILAVRIKTGITPDIHCENASVWAAYESGRMALMAPSPLPAHIKPDSNLRQLQTVVLKHALEWAVETIPLGSII